MTTKEWMLCLIKNGQKHKVVEIGAQSRLETFRKGMEMGLLVAGYTRLLGQGANVSSFSKGSETLKLVMVTTEVYSLLDLE